eukprot:g4496.t1
MKSSLSPGPGHDQASQGGKDIHTIAKSSETNSEVTKADDDVPAPALAEKQKSTNDQQTTALTPIFQGKTNTVFATKDLSFHIDNDEKKSRKPHSVLVTNMTRHGWS